MDVRNGVGGAVRSDSSGIPNCHQSDIQKWNTHPYDNSTMYCYYFYKLEDILQSWNYYCPCVLEDTLFHPQVILKWSFTTFSVWEEVMGTDWLTTQT